MKFKFIYLFFSLLLSATLFLSNSGGRASAAGKGNTGAPGDEMSGATLRVCGSCHQGATDFQVAMAVEIIDTKGNKVLGYAPDETYYVKVSLTKSGNGTPKGYGFQLSSLFGATNEDVNGFNTPDANVQIAQANSNKRFYAEHKGVSSSNVFKLKWKAPKAGSGKVTFYGAGNAVNKTGDSSGDAAATTKLELTEGFKVGVEDALQNTLSLELSIAPNPVLENATLRINSMEQETLTLQVTDVMGKMLMQQNLENVQDGYQYPINLSNWTKGVYFVSVFNQKGRVTKQVVKY
ncbi:MAG: hypothetical protein RLZZ292_589 [Bacteroidota bacterium]|jgi:hypothetical protein